METLLTANSILISLVCAVALTVLVTAVNWVWWRPKKLEKWFRQQGIPGTSYKFLSGDLKDLSFTHSEAIKTPMTGFSNDFIPRIQPLRHQLMSQFGDVYFMWSGPTPMINISKPELIKEALTKMQVFHKPQVNPIVDKLFSGLVNFEGDKWAEQRRIVNPAFHTEKLKLMLPALRDSCVEMIDKWENLVAGKGSTELDILPYLRTLSADAISRAAFGSNYEEGQKIFDLLQKQLVLALNMLQSVYIPGLRYIPTARNRTFNKVDNQIQTALRTIVEKRKHAIDKGEAAKPDLLGVLMDSSLKDMKQSGGNNFSRQIEVIMQEVINECKLFYLAGQDTTSLLLVWTLILLSKHQDWQERAREEILQTFGNDTPDYEGLNHLKTVTMILYEVLRLYSPVPQINRRVYKDTKLGELLLPAGALLNFHLLLVHRSKELWGDDADVFKPDRFAEGISKAARGNISFLPFSWGPRICIGEKFAMIEAKMALSIILQHFYLELSPSYVHAPMTVFTLLPQHGAQVILHKR